MVVADDYNSLIEVLDAFPDDEACVEHLVALRWPSGVVCPHCSSSQKHYNLSRSHGFRCSDCRKEFSVRKGTIFEESRLPLRKWFAAAWLSSCQLAREIGVMQKTAWFMLGRLRDVAAGMNGAGGPLDGEVEANEVYLGGKAKNMHADARERRSTGRGAVDKYPVAGALERNGRVRTRKMASTTAIDLHDFIKRNVTVDARLFTDEHASYRGLGGWYDHQWVKHSVGEYVRGQAHMNSIESFWAMLKRSYIGVLHHFTWKHLHRYLAQIEARWNLDTKMRGEYRTDTLLRAVSGRRLTYAELIQ